MPWIARLGRLLAEHRGAALLSVALSAAAGIWLIGPGPSRASRRGDETARTWVVKRADVKSGVWAMGDLASSRSVIVKNRLPGADGRILWIVDDGAEVKEGDVLVRLDSSGFEVELKRLESEFMSQKAMVEAARQTRLGEQSRA